MAIIETKKRCVQERVITNGAFRFVGRLFLCPAITERTAIWVAYDSFRDTEVEIFSDTGASLGVATWQRGLEVSHG